MNLMKDPNFDSRFASQWVDLAQERLGGVTLYCTDDFFAGMENLIKPGRGVFIEDKYTDRGKWMDGWESRRKRTEGYDYCVLKLGAAGAIVGLDIDTNHFLGNHPPFASVEACYMPDGEEPDFHSKEGWVEILSKSALQPGSQNLFVVENGSPFTHLRLNIYPDGGVARFRVYGRPYKDWDAVDENEEVDLAACKNGGMSVLCNDMFFSPKDNLILPGRPYNMGDGWETRRRREPGNDWIIVALGTRGIIKRCDVDTTHFKGNFPDSCELLGVNLEVGQREGVNDVNLEWKPLLNQTKLHADRVHSYDEEVQNIGPVTHVKLNIFPCGGIARLRLYGTKA